MATRPRSTLATIIGWIIVALVVYWLLGAIIGTIRFLVRFTVWLVIVGALIVLYLNLKAPDD